MDYTDKCIAFYEKQQEYRRKYAKKYYKEYYHKHKDDEGVKERLKQRNASYYQRNKEKILARLHAKREREKNAQSDKEE